MLHAAERARARRGCLGLLGTPPGSSSFGRCAGSISYAAREARLPTVCRGSAARYSSRTSCPGHWGDTARRWGVPPYSAAWRGLWALGGSPRLYHKPPGAPDGGRSFVPTPPEGPPLGAPKPRARPAIPWRPCPRADGALGNSEEGSGWGALRGPAHAA